MRILYTNYYTFYKQKYICLQTQIPEVNTAIGVTGEVGDEDEAAKAVRSILGHNETHLEEKISQQNIVTAHARNRSNNFDSNEIEANKENSEAIKRSIRLKEKTVQEFTNPQPPQQQQQQQTRGIKRPACSTVEIQYVSSESTKLDAPGKLKWIIYRLEISQVKQNHVSRLGSSL